MFRLWDNFESCSSLSYWYYWVDSLENKVKWPFYQISEIFRIPRLRYQFQFVRHFRFLAHDKIFWLCKNLMVNKMLFSKYNGCPAKKPDIETPLMVTFSLALFAVFDKIFRPWKLVFMGLLNDSHVILFTCSILRIMVLYLKIFTKTFKSFR